MTGNHSVGRTEQNIQIQVFKNKTFLFTKRISYADDFNFREKIIIIVKSK